VVVKRGERASEWQSKVRAMVLRETGLGVFASAALGIGALALVACGKSTRLDAARSGASGGSGGSSGATGSGASGGSSGAAGSGASGGSSGATGGSNAGSNGVGGAAGGSATGGSPATAGSAGTADGGSIGNAGDGGAGGAEESASFHWIETTEDHRERAASATKPAFLRTLILPPYDASALIGTSDLILGENTEELYTEGFVWTEATGTTALGALPGVTPAPFRVLSYPRAISADSSVVVGFAVSMQHLPVPFRWTRADGMEAIAQEGGTAVAVNADGSVVLGAHEAPITGVFRWTRALGAVTIVEPLAGNDGVRALALSADGTMVLAQSFGSGDAAERLVVWTQDSGARAIENLPGYAWCLVEHTRPSRSHGIVAGGWCFNEAGNEPFVWAGQDHLVALGPTDALDAYEPENPVAITADGSVAVGRSTRAANESRVYRWTEATGLELVELPEGYTSSTSAAMSEDGSVVVGRMSGTADHSFLWSAGAGAVVLSPLEGHDSCDVYVVSADGSVAAGSSRLGAADSTAVYWRADGVPHRIAGELAVGGVDLGGGALGHAQGAQAPLGFFGYGSKDQASTYIGWFARLP
jgi:uncharacterized membrane protein